MKGASLPSASRLELLETCIGSAVFPQVDRVSEHADRGTAKHRFLARALDVGRDEALAEVPAEHREACAALELGELPHAMKGSWAAEVAYALDVTTGEARELGRGIERRYEGAGLKPTELPGTTDLEGLSADGESVIVIDAKTGYRRVTRARDNLQLLFQAVAAARARGKLNAHAFILYVDEEGTPRWDGVELDAFALDDVASRLCSLGRKVLEARALAGAASPIQPRLRVGEHCVDCPSLPFCPATGAFARALVTAPEETVADLQLQLTAETAPLVYGRLRAVEAALAMAWKAVTAYAMRSPIPLGNGEVFGLVQKVRESLDAKVTRKVLAEKFGADIAEAAVEYATSKAAVERALKMEAFTRGSKVAPLVREALAAISAAGGVISKTTSNVEAHRPKPPELKAVND